MTKLVKEMASSGHILFVLLGQGRQLWYPSDKEQHVELDVRLFQLPAPWRIVQSVLHGADDSRQSENEEGQIRRRESKWRLAER